MKRLNRPRVLLADDHRMLAESLTNLLSSEFEVVGVVEDGRALLAAARSLRPDVIVTDITMPHLNGLDALPLLKKDDPKVKIIVLAMHQHEDRSEQIYSLLVFEIWHQQFLRQESPVH